MPELAIFCGLKVEDVFCSVLKINVNVRSFRLYYRG